MKYLTYIFIAGLLLVVGCGVSTEDIDATVQARMASIPTPTPQIVTRLVEKEVVKEVEVIKEIPLEVVTVEVILEVVVTATPIPEPTVAQGNVYEWDDISLEYENNAIVANSKYQNQTISIRGEIRDIDYRGKDYFTGENDDWREEIPSVDLRASMDAGNNLLRCGLDSIDEVANLSVGDTVLVKGKIREWDGSWLYAYPCSIVD